MRRFALALLPLAVLVAGCTSTDYDLMQTAALSSKFKDSDPQDFGARSPHRHPIHGIDVSKYNDHVDWEMAKKSGVSFAFIKATEGKDRVDPKFDEFWRGARAANVAYAPYHFYYFCSTPDQQADWFIANVPREAVKLPPVLDAEWNPASPTCKLRPDPATVRADLKRFMDRLQAYYGKKPIIYTSVDFHRDNFVGYFKDYQFWLRSVASHPDEKYADRKWAFWQYTSTGIVPGVGGQTDINVFGGSQDNWKSWLAYADAR